MAAIMPHRHDGSKRPDITSTGLQMFPQSGMVRDSYHGGRMLRLVARGTDAGRLRPSLLPPLLVALGIAASGTAGRAATCALPLQGEGRVAAVLDSRTLRLNDGSEIRLAGIEPTARATEAQALLSGLMVGRDVRLHGETDAPDRYGRQLAFVFAADDTLSAQSRLIGAGAALMAGNIADKACAAELATAERDARRAKRGIWVDNDVIKNTESPGDILSDVGRFALVEGRVWSVRQVGAVTYLNFGRRWTQDFAAIISRRMVAAYEQAGITLKSFERRRIRVRGWLERRIGPRIEVVRLGQIEVVGDE
jgi:endonuclease YncB( thermonuclease family)